MTSLQQMSRNPFQKRFAYIIGFGAIIVVSMVFSFYIIIAGWMMSHAIEPAARVIGLSQFAHWAVSESFFRNVLFSVIFMGLTILIVQKGVENGIEKWSKRLMPLLVILLVVLITYVLTLEGAGKGLEAYLKPDFSRVFEPDLIISALGQAFFSLSVGAGLNVIYGSYISKKESLISLGTKVTLIDVSIAFLAGLLIIPAMYVAQAQGVIIFADNGSLVSGPTIVFDVLPNLFNNMGSIGWLVSFIFFVLMSVAALTTLIAMLETLVAYAIERYGLARKKASILIAAVILGIIPIEIMNRST